MNQYKSCSELKNIAKEKLNGKYSSAMLVSPVLPFAISFAVLFSLYMIILIPFIVIAVLNDSNLSTGLTTTLIVVVFIIVLLAQILMGILNAGITLFYLNIACGKRHSVSNLFFGFRWQFKKALAYSAITLLLSNLCLLPYQIFAILMQFDPQLKWNIGALFFYIIGVIIYIPIQLSLSQYLYLLLDFPQYSIKELLKLSVHVMKGHKKRLFYLQLSFIPLQILCLFSFYIGYLWLIPYMNMTSALFFLDIMKPKQTPEPHFDQYV